MQGLDELFRAAQGTARQAYARRFLDVTLPSMAEAMRRLEQLAGAGRASQRMRFVDPEGGHVTAEYPEVWLD